MIKVKLIDKDGNPVVGAIVMLDSIPYDGYIQDIAAESDNNGIVVFDCNSVKGEYTFKISLETGNLVTLRIENPIDDNVDILVLKL